MCPEYPSSLCGSYMELLYRSQMQKTPEKHRNNARHKEKQKARTLPYLFNGTTPYFTSIIELSSSNVRPRASFPTKAMTFYCVFQDADSAHYLGSHTSKFQHLQKSWDIESIKNN